MKHTQLNHIYAEIRKGKNPSIERRQHLNQPLGTVCLVEQGSSSAIVSSESRSAISATQLHYTLSSFCTG